MQEFSDIWGEEVDLFGPVMRSITISSDDMNLELSKYAMTFIDDTQMFAFNMDVPTQTDTPAPPKHHEQLEQSATSEMTPEERPVSEELERPKEGQVDDTSTSKDWRLLKNRGWVRTLRRRSDLNKKFYDYTNPDVLSHDTITSMKRAMLIDKSRGVTNIKRKRD